MSEALAMGIVGFTSAVLSGICGYNAFRNWQHWLIFLVCVACFYVGKAVSQ